MNPQGSIGSILREARKLITPERQWTQHQRARDKTGAWVDPWIPEAACWCALGAIEKICHERNMMEMINPVLRSLQKEMRDGSVSLYNDTESHGKVLKAFDRAIQMEEGDLT